ncbi:MAG: hypothetical protein SCK28_04485 [Bacillota bacterium]|nr:hypothetical protein [Bacillota bacterium]
MSSNLLENKKPIKELLISLSHAERSVLKSEFANVPPGANLSFALMAMGANLLPKGNYSLAEKVLQSGLKVVKKDEDKARLHLNLAQLYHDLYSQTFEAILLEKISLNCQQCLQLGYFIDFIPSYFNISEN